jgi:hypothetical protein
MKKWNDVTSLERSAMARIKGGVWPCNGSHTCSGAGQTTKELIEIQKSPATLDLEVGPEEEDAEDFEG